MRTLDTPLIYARHISGIDRKRKGYSPLVSRRCKIATLITIIAEQVLPSRQRADVPPIISATDTSG